MEQIIFLLALPCLGYIFGTIAESRHYTSIREREKGFLGLPAVNVKKMGQTEQHPDHIEKAALVQGSVVISIDYFKRILAGIRNFFGGKVGAYESLLDRARREAVLRMKESCPDADIILNTRIETSAIGQTSERRVVGSIEAIAYGTAITYRNKNEKTA